MADRHGTHLVRITLEARSPLAIGSGDTLVRTIKEKLERTARQGSKPVERLVTHRALVRDPDGLPAIPARSLRGVLRHLAVRRYGEPCVRALLGWAGSEHDGRAGRVRFGWGRAHGANDACPSLGSENDDPILRLLRREAPLLRDHVAIDNRGIVDGRRKFLVAAVPTGTRFSLQLSMRGREHEWGTSGSFGLAALVGLLADPELRIGAGVTRGYGALTVLNASQLWLPFDRDGIVALREHLAEPSSQHFVGRAIAMQPDETTEVHEITLAARSLVGIGGQIGERGGSLVPADKVWAQLSGGTPPMEVSLPESASKPAPLLVDTVIDWTGGQGKERRAFSFPGASLKGPLAHRTLYWWNRQNARVIDVAKLATQDGERMRDAFSRRPPALQVLFGAIKDSETASGRAGAVTFRDDVFHATHVMRVDHVSIDRFTGGARDRSGALFSEELLFGAEARMRFTLHRPDDVDRTDWNGAIRAFRAALDDLVGGRLPIGGRGWGRMDGEHTLTEGAG
jgi:CRISPR/Cas system CSM-associated protein Csm3 (group 7 of RAMP superfamily)